MINVPVCLILQIFAKGCKLAPSNKVMQDSLVQCRVQTARAMGNAAFQEHSYAEAAKHYRFFFGFPASKHCMRRFEILLQPHIAYHYYAYIHTMEYHSMPQFTLSLC